jgi:CHASE2 domain-containing sensor protein
MQKQYESDTRPVKPAVYAVIILCCFFCALLLSFLLHVPFSIVENQKNDLLFRVRYALSGKQEISPHLVHVVLDDTTIRNLQLAPGDRGIYSQVLQILSVSGAKVIACDIFFQFGGQGEPDTSLVQVTENSAVIHYPVIVQPAGYPLLQNTQYIPEEIKKKILWYPGVVRKADPPQAGGVSIPFQTLSYAARGLGHINCQPDNDGINRRFPLPAR